MKKMKTLFKRQFENHNIEGIVFLSWQWRNV